MPDLNECRILVTPTSFAKIDSSLRSDLERQVKEVKYNTAGRPLSSDELLELIPGCDGYIAGLDDINRAVIAAADRLKVIARYGVGVDNVDLLAARERGIVVTNTPGANAVSVAELTVGLILSLARSIPAAVQAARSGGWPRISGISLEGKTVGLLGFGAVGREVARRLAGFECKLLTFDPACDLAAAEALGVQLIPQPELIRESDFLSLHLTLGPETRGLVDGEFLSQMKPGAYLINTARGELIDESALFDAVRIGHLRGAALDAFAEQPPKPDNPLLALPQVIATPHMGAHTDAATNAMGRVALQDCLAVLRGAEPAHRVA